MQMNGTEDAKAAIKEALGLESSAYLVNGLSVTDVKKLLDLVVKKNRVAGRRVEYILKRVGQNATADKPWNEKLILALLGKSAKYVLLGSATRSGGADGKLAKGIANAVGEEERLEKWCSIKKHRKSDHAIGLVVDVGGEAFLIDNGLKRRMIPFHILGVVKRLTHLTGCYDL